MELIRVFSCPNDISCDTDLGICKSLALRDNSYDITGLDEGDYSEGFSRGKDS